MWFGGGPKSKLLLDVVLNEMFRDLDIREKNNEKVIILFCGRLIKKKGIYLLLDIAEKMQSDLEFEIHMYGDGPEKEKLLKMISRKGLSDVVFLKGQLSYYEMNKAYQSADIFLFPSLRESGGNVLIEAMANALPVVSLNMSVSRQLNKLHTGLFIDTEHSKEKIINAFTQALYRLIKSPDLRRQLGMNGYKYVNHELNWDVIIEKVYGGNLEKIKANKHMY